MLKFIKNVLMFLIIVMFYSNVCGQQNLDFNFDYARFNYDSSSIYLEVYYSFDQNDLTVVEKDGKSIVEGLIHMEIQDSSTGEYFLKKDWKVQNEVVSSEDENQNKSLIGIINMVVPAGVYEMVVEGRDFNNQEIKKVLKDKLITQPFNNTEAIISDIQLSTSIVQDGADPNSIFYKNTLEVVPNPSMLYSNNNPVLFFYSELYNVLNSNSKMEKLLFKSSGNLVYNDSKFINSKQNSLVEVGLLNLSKYPTDTYNFVLTLIDTVTKKAKVSNKKFYLYNPGVEDTFSVANVNTNFISSEFGVYTEEECDNMHNYIKYISTKRENELYSELDSLTAKREFLFNFWSNRDPKPETVRNEYKDEFMERVEYVARNFGNKYKPAYKTDRARIFLLYGMPDQLDRFPNEPNVKPHEIWFYNGIEGGVQFVFASMTGFNYELVHSTKRGELRDDNWSRRVITE